MGGTPRADGPRPGGGQRISCGASYHAPGQRGVGAECTIFEKGAENNKALFNPPPRKDLTQTISERNEEEGEMEDIDRSIIRNVHFTIIRQYDICSIKVVSQSDFLASQTRS